MFYVVRRFHFAKAFAFATLLAVPGLVAQQIDECESDCHIQASEVYNDMKAAGRSEKDALAIGAAHKAVCVFASCG